jgi:FkbM family methyltransferase
MISGGFQTRIRNILDKESASAPDWDYGTIERIRDSFQDDASGQQYEQEIVYLALRESGIAKAEKYSPCNNKQWQSAALLAKIIQNGFHFQRLNGWQIPELEVPAGSPDLEFYFQIATFIFEQYRYNNDVCVRSGDVVFDCGACFGDLAVWALSYGASSVHCFEPDAINLAVLKNNAARYGNDKIKIIPGAVGKESGTVQFVHDSSFVASKIAETAASGAQTVPIISIDDYVKEHGIAPSFIKIDVEGHEMDVLSGARETIAKHKPQLAVCLYHKPSDMWTVPALIREILPAYRYWCRKNHPVSEFVLYSTI